jgi:hypothetical protein
MKRLLYLALLLAPACHGGERYDTGKCPAGEICSTATPYGLQFIPPALYDDVLNASDAAIAVGGTSTVNLDYEPSGSLASIPLDLAYTADDSGGPAVRVTGQSGSQVALRGTATGGNLLRILDASDGQLFDRKLYDAGVIDHFALGADSWEYTANTNIVYSTGNVHVGVQLMTANGSRLIDTGLQVTGAQLTEWDRATFAAPVTGTYSIAVTAGGAALGTHDVTVVDHADTITAIDPPAAIPPAGSATVCFGALLGSASVVGLTWSFTVDGTVVAPGSYVPDCIDAQTTKTTGTVIVVASAGGASATMTLPIMATHRDLPAHAISPSATFDGERAALNH